MSHKIYLLEEYDSYLNHSIISVQTYLDYLNQTIVSIEGYTEYLNNSINNVNSTTIDQFNTFRDTIMDIRNELTTLTIQEDTNTTYLRTQIEALNISLLEATSQLLQLMNTNDSALNGYYLDLSLRFANLTRKVDGMNISVTNITNITQEITQKQEYNDTALWNEINKLKAVPPGAVINNTTINNPVTYVNKTQQLSLPPLELYGFLGGMVSGCIITGVSFALIYRKRHKFTP